MRNTKLHFALLALLATLTLATPTREAVAQESAPVSEAAAIDLEELRAERKRKAGLYSVDPRISRYLGAAAEAVDEGDPEEGKRLLHKLRPKRLNPYERALVYRMLAYISYGMNDATEAIDYFKKVLVEKVLPIRDEARVRLNVAQLYASLQEWRKVIDWLSSWLRYVGEPDPLGIYLMAMSYYQLQEYDNSIVQARKAIALSEEPREAWMRLLAALYSQNHDYENAAPVLEELVLRFPKKQYWVQLSLIYGARDDYRRSLAVQQVAYTQGLLTEDKALRRLARSYLYHELPYPAAKVLEEAISSGAVAGDAKSYELLANSWIAAREYDRSYEPLYKAAELSDDGNLYVRLGQVRMQREAWDEAAGYLEKSIEKGSLKEPGNAVLLLGIAYYNGDRTERARTAFLAARQHASTRTAADGWITHIEAKSRAPGS